MTNRIVRRECSGSYTVEIPGKGVCEVVRYSVRNGDGFDGWIARVRGDRYAYTDPLPTKRDAIWAATEMLTGE